LKKAARTSTDDLTDLDWAKAFYTRLVKEYPNSPLAGNAQANKDRLESQSKDLDEIKALVRVGLFLPCLLRPRAEGRRNRRRNRGEGKTRRGGDQEMGFFLLVSPSPCLLVFTTCENGPSRP
jgi:hypothetical protein